MICSSPDILLQKWKMYTKYSVGKLEENISLRRFRHRYQDKIKIGVRRILCDDVDWIHLSPDTGHFRSRVSTFMKI
jgi:hypothetical protein